MISNPPYNIIAVSKLTELPIEIMDSYHALTNLCFSDNRRTEERRLEVHDNKIPNKDLVGYVLAISRDTVISTATCYARRILYQDEVIYLGGIGGVCTHPDNRGNGIATAVVDKAMSYLEDMGVEVMFLATETDNPKMVRFYSRLGMMLMTKPYAYTGSSGKHYQHSSGMMASLTSPRKFRYIRLHNEPFYIGKGNW